VDDGRPVDRPIDRSLHLSTHPIPTNLLDARLRSASARWRLSPKQSEVLGRLALGESNKEIAVRLLMSVRTVEQHVAAILKRAKVDSRLRLVARVWRG
jgi:DNA-binding NarL/FixJ family response regulator